MIRLLAACVLLCGCVGQIDLGVVESAEIDLAPLQRDLSLLQAVVAAADLPELARQIQSVRDEAQLVDLNQDGKISGLAEWLAVIARIAAHR